MASDDFNRADGGLGANWERIDGDNALAISSFRVVGQASVECGARRIGEAYAGNHYSSIEVTSDAMASNGWIGAAIRCPGGIQPPSLNYYLGIYYNNAGTFTMQLYKRINGSYTQLGSDVTFGAVQDPAGTVFKLSGNGSSLSFQRNGVEQIGLTDSSLAPGGAPGIATFNFLVGLDNWSGDNIGGVTNLAPVIAGRGAC